MRDQIGTLHPKFAFGGQAAANVPFAKFYLCQKHESHIFILDKMGF